MNKKQEGKVPEDQMDKRSEYDHEAGVLTEPKRGDDPKTSRHQVDPVRDPSLFEDLGNGPVPRRADPFAHQRDEKTAKAANKKEAAKAEDAQSD